MRQRPEKPEKSEATPKSEDSKGGPKSEESKRDSTDGAVESASGISERAAPAAAPASDGIVGSGEFRSSADRRSTLIAGISSFGVKRATYSNVNGLGIFEGDIVLGTVEKLAKTQATADAVGLQPTSASGRGQSSANIQFSVAITGQRYRWPGNLIPYQVQPDIQSVVDEAIKHWKERTSIRFIERTPANATSYPNYVSFEVGDGCFSAVGMQGGSQIISLGPGCGLGQAIHEIGHAVGLWHEQGREDRDQFVHIAWENIIPNMEHNFDQHITDGDDIGRYDYDSIMHYPATAFSSNGLDTIVALGGQPIGQRNGLSDGDVAAVLQLYPGAVGSAHHMYTKLLLEFVRALRDLGYRSEGIGFYGWPVPIAGTVPLLKLSDAQGRQLHTTSQDEAYEALSKNGVTFEDVTCYLFSSPASGLAPLFRLENEAERDSLLTTSLLEAQQAAAHGYAGKGVAGYVLTSYVTGALPIYRMSRAG